MIPTELAGAALLKAYAALRKPAQPSPDAAVSAEPELPISGASFLQHEPDLAKEAGLRSREMSGWAMGSSSISD